MDLNPYVDAVRRDLAVAAAAGGPDAETVAERLVAPLDSAVRLRLQEAVVDAAAEISLALAAGSVDVRLAGRGLAFVVVAPPAAAGPESSLAGRTDPSSGEDGGDEGGTSRITFRPSDRLKADIEAAAEAQGLSVNAFLVRTLTGAVRGGTTSASPASAATSATAATAHGGQRLSGWVR